MFVILDSKVSRCSARSFAYYVLRTRAGADSRSKIKGSELYLDMTMVEKYWGSDRTYHHTAPISMNYALREALRIVCDEGLEARWRRHELNHRALVAGVEAMGLQMNVAREHRLWSLNAIRVPDGVDDARVRGRLLNDSNIEIGGGSVH
jgi:alanine-glyoxylate transaminase/serine-glyoxylate transaminase/serine-pyruvate transaminase